MPPERSIKTSRDDYATAITLCNQLNAAAPGKYTVGVGLKQTGGAYTNQLALFVCVSKKIPAEEVPEPEFVPPEFYSYVTDVIEYQPVLAVDEMRYDPLRGGIQISRPSDNGILAPGSGTLGTIVYSRLNQSQLLLTCAHVVNPISINLQVQQPINRDIFQPGLGVPGAAIVGTVENLRYEGSPLYLDCAVIQPNSSRGLQKVIEDIGSVKGVSIEVPALGEVVKKRGARTLLTEGFVVGHIPGAVPAVSAILVSGAVPLVSVFAGGGDSGSVLLNARDQVVGLLYGTPNDDLGSGLSSGGLAMPIYTVQEALQVDVAVEP